MEEIRKVKPEDNKALATMIRGVFDEYKAPCTGTVYSDPTTDHLFELFDREGAVLWVAEADGAVVGCGGVYPTEGLETGWAEVVKLYLRADARGRGLGRKMIEKIMQSARDLGYKNLYLESMPEFARAVAMYRKLGFKMLPHPMGNSGHTSCNIWMEIEL